MRVGRTEGLVGTNFLRGGKSQLFLPPLPYESGESLPHFDQNLGQSGELSQICSFRLDAELVVEGLCVIFRHTY